MSAILPARSRASHVRLTRRRILLEFLGSMNLAIILLVALALASVIGTVLQQNQPYPDYLAKLGPFWFEMFARLGLYDVYGAAWFLGILLFLLVSTSVCLYRHTPVVLGQMRNFRSRQQVASLRALQHHREWQLEAPGAELATRAKAVLSQHGYRVRESGEGNPVLLTGLSGRGNRLGYILTHLAVVVICIGGLLDSNPALRIAGWTGSVQPATGNPAHGNIAPESRIGVGPGAFKGSITIPEGAAASAVLLHYRDGYLIRDLPFRITVERFHIERYANGEPRSFETDVAITPRSGGEVVRETISVNRPLSYDNHRIYQSSFTDGGSHLRYRVWPLQSGSTAQDGAARVFERTRLDDDKQPLTLEFTHLEPFNARLGDDRRSGFNVAAELGPSYRYRITDATGSTLEFENTMQPVDMDGGRYFISGMRHSESEPFRYLHIPADQNDSPARFMALVDVLTGDDLARAASAAGATVAEDLEFSAPALQQALAETAQRLVQRLNAGSSGSAPDASMPSALSDALVQETLTEAYRLSLARTGDDANRSLTGADAAFIQHAASTVPALGGYGAPVFIQLLDFDHIQASGLEITRAPGQPIVYAGFILLIAGIICMFFLQFRRIWCHIEPTADGQCRVLIAGQSPRDPIGQQQHFQRLQNALEHHLGGVVERRRR
ncbi:cytochrome c biogenesis protein [Natronocella acetinitrilica]|uniref:Cytochrome c biogenesis protein n=1 Tax=Natronocella acetinitrilica TaxID=414046 RepID=A0AAE3G4L3_9GAMM|nr:cytochrome c biogenesis protein ResB [Natronocella acetinitrilica]MCP1674651.1 cytochrome c biogenesis protein [Natronocella acetinitrilica]